MQKLKQTIVKRESHITNVCYKDVEIKEDFKKFVERVTDACEAGDGKFRSVSYPSEDVAVILYKWSDGLH